MHRAGHGRAVRRCRCRLTRGPQRTAPSPEGLRQVLLLTHSAVRRANMAKQSTWLLNGGILASYAARLRCLDKVCARSRAEVMLHFAHLWRGSSIHTSLGCGIGARRCPAPEERDGSGGYNEDDCDAAAVVAAALPTGCAMLPGRLRPRAPRTSQGAAAPLASSCAGPQGRPSSNCLAQGLAWPGPAAVRRRRYSLG